LHDCTNTIARRLHSDDAPTLFTLAAERGYPALVVEYPDGKARFHIAGTREGWELALPELERENLIITRCWNAPTPSHLAEPVNRTPLVWDLIDDWLQSASNPEDPYGLEPEELDAVRIMLAYAEARGFPALTLTEYGYTIHGDMAGWLTAAQQLAGTPAIARRRACCTLWTRAVLRTRQHTTHYFATATRVLPRRNFRYWRDSLWQLQSRRRAQNPCQRASIASS
jgi:hypothetical protein